MIGNVLSLLIALLILTAVWTLISGMFDTFRKDFSLDSMGGKSPPSGPEVRTHPAKKAERVDVLPELATPLVVKHLDHGKATLILRYRSRNKACTAQLIVWSGAKRRRIQDSYYDLGVIAKDKVDDDVVKDFLKRARERLDELVTAGKRTRKKKTLAIALQGEGVPEEHPDDQPVATDSAAMDVDPTPALASQLKKFPSVYRGIITEAGMMTQERNGAQFNIYGVRYRTQDGLEDAVFGANLKIALREAMAGVGDTVEILKIGRKTIEKGKAPMNLFKVAKIASITSRP